MLYGAGLGAIDAAHDSPRSGLFLIEPVARLTEGAAPAEELDCLDEGTLV